MPRPLRTGLVPGLLISLLISLWPPAAWARPDHDQARAAVQAGEVLPLRTLLDRLEKSHPGQVLEVELERDDGRWVYELKLLQAGGRLVKLKVDARSGELLSARARDGGERLRDGSR